MRGGWTAIGIAAGLAVVTLLSSAGQLLKWGGNAALALYSALVFGITVYAALPQSDRLFSNKKVVTALWAVLAAFLFVSFLILYPLAHSGLLGPGTDRDEALNLAIHALLSGHYPYYAVTRFGAPITPLPGALALALPFYLIGNASYQVLFWAPAFLLFSSRTFPSSKQAALFFGLCVAGNLAFLQDYVSGGDYAINIFYVTIAAALLQSRTARNTGWTDLILPMFLMGVTLASRPIWGILLPLLFFQNVRSIGMLKSFTACAVPLAIMLGLCLPFYAYDPAHFSPLHIASFASSAIPHATLVLPAVALLMTFVALALPANRFNLFGVASLALGVILLPTTFSSLGKFNGEVVNWFGYCYPLTVWGGFWLASHPIFAPAANKAT